MGPVETILCLLVAVAVLATLARRLHIAEPIPFVLGGLTLGFFPAVADVNFPPDVVFLLFIPPLVFRGAYLTPWRDFKSNLRPILGLAVGMVLATIFAVAAVTKAVVSDLMPWSVAFVLATIVAPPDAVAVMSITQHLKVPRRIVNVLEGESLANDSVALVAYKMAIAAAVTGTFSLATAGRQLAWAGVGGVIIGLLVGALSLWLRRQLSDPPVQVTLSLLTPFAAYLPAEAVEASGVLAVVTAGVLISRYSSRFFSAEVRTLGMSFWRMVEFLLNGLAFILVGLQLRKVYFQLGDYPTGELLKDTSAIVLTVIVIRLLWVFPAAYLPLYFIPWLRRRNSYPPWQRSALIGWAGIRGVDSLATALAVPLVVSAGTPFPSRNLVIFLSFAVILATLVLQGLSLPSLIRWLKVRDDGLDQNEEMKGRSAAAEAALRRLDELAQEAWALPVCVERIREMYTGRIQRFRARLHHDGDQHYEENAALMRRLHLELLNEERRAIIDLRDREVISDDVLGRIKNVVIDFHRTDYYASTALIFFMRLWTRVKRGNGLMAFCNLSDHEKEILQVTKLDRLWPICESREQALQAVRA
jgi:CPA1 family monovalent cation:H+ antiporter